MQSKVVRTLGLLLVLGCVSIVLGQQQNPGGPGNTPSNPKLKKKMRVEDEEESPKPAKQKATPKKSTLEEMLAEALKNNPDIRVAAAKLAEADAELNRTRLQVTQKVVMLYHAIETQKQVVESAESKGKRAQRLFLSGSITEEDIHEIRQTLALAKAKLAELEAQAPALLGKSQSSNATESVRSAAVTALEAVGATYRYRVALNEVNLEFEPAVPEGKLAAVQLKANIPQAEKIRKALQTPIKVDYKDMAFDDILKDLSKQFPGLSFRSVRLHYGGKINLRLEEALPVSAILQALADETGCTFFVREYGILATYSNDAPPGAITVEEFLRQKPAKEPAATTNPDPFSSLPWQPPENIEGSIKSISPNGWVEIELNSVDGLLTGHTLHVYRPSDASAKPKYLGTIRIIGSVRSQRQGGKGKLGQPVGRLSEPPKVGDRVSARKPVEGKNPPAADVEGRVKAVDASGLMTIGIGSDVGLAKGHTLELFRLAADKPSESKYLGTLRIVEVEAHQSVAQAIGRLTAPPRPGDRVASRLLGK